MFHAKSGYSGNVPLVVLFFFLAAGLLRATQSSPTYAQDVAPILFGHCSSCHHEGQSAPFPLISYRDAKTHARLIAEVTRDHVMPPWKPVGSKGSPRFAGDRTLTPVQIETLSRWAEGGAPEGDTSKLLAPPKFSDAAWKLGNPDLVLELPMPFDVPAVGADLYQCFVVPVHMASNRYIRAIEFRPGNPRLVHHALLFTDVSHIKVSPTYPCFGSIGLLPTNGLGGWSPGNAPIRMPEGAAIPLQRASRLIAQIHYRPTGKPEVDQWRVAFYFTDQAPTRHVVDIGLSSRQISIPPGDAHYVVRDHFDLPVPVWAIGIIPHAHYVCREMHGWAVLPNGRKIHLLDILDWDFNWQDQYRYEQPFELPEDTRIEMEFVYDNSPANPRNPHSPPQRVNWGAGISDEMAGLHLQAIPVHMEDLPELGRALWGKVMRSVGGSFYRLPQ